MPNFNTIKTDATQIQRGDTVLAGSINIEQITKGKRINERNLVVTSRTWSRNADSLRIEGTREHDESGTTYTMYLHGDAMVTIVREEQTEEERRAERLEEAERLIRMRRKACVEALDNMMSNLLGEDGKVSADKFVHDVRWGRLDEVIDYQTQIAAIDNVYAIVERQEAGEAHGDLLDAIEMVEANYELEARRLLSRTTSSKSTNGYSNAAEEAEGVARAKVGTGCITTYGGYGELYGPTERFRAATARLRGE